VGIGAAKQVSIARVAGLVSVIREWEGVGSTGVGGERSESTALA